MPAEDVSPIPDPVLHEFRVEVEALPARKQSKWRGIVQDTNGVAHRVHFVSGEFVFKHHSQWVKLVALTDMRLGHSLEFTPGTVTQAVRALRAQANGGFKAAEDELRLIINETATGNHRSKPHKIRVPTGAGDPVRG